MSTIQDTDLLLVNRGGKDYKVSLSDLYLYINPVASFVTASVGTSTSDWTPYVTLQTYIDKNPYTEASPPITWWFDPDNRNPNLIFDGDPDEVFKWSSEEWLELEFRPPNGIRVYESFSILAGFADTHRDGIVDINGEFAKEHSAWDDEPEEFFVPYNGTLESFSIRQKNPTSSGSYSGGISQITLDGKVLTKRLATTLTFESSKFFDRLKIGTKLKQVSPEVEGVVSAIDSDNLKVTLDDVYAFEPGKTIIIVGEDKV